MRRQRPGHALPLLLLAGFRQVIDELHHELAGRGHPDVRPVHGFALQSVGAEGVSIADLARRLGVSKQAAAKTAAALERLGYLHSAPDPADRRARRLQLTARGADLLDVSARVLSDIRDSWAEQLGGTRMDELERDLEQVLGPARARLRVDLPGWLDGSAR